MNTQQVEKLLVIIEMAMSAHETSSLYLVKEVFAELKVLEKELPNTLIPWGHSSGDLCTAIAWMVTAMSCHTDKYTSLCLAEAYAELHIFFQPKRNDHEYW